MNEDKSVKVPQFEGEKMKMPENHDTRPTVKKEPGIVNGPLLIILTLLLLLILGGLYYWFGVLSLDQSSPTNTTRPTFEENTEPESTTAEAQTGSLQTMSTSDELSVIESDLEATNLESLTAEMGIIDNEIGKATE
jgi:hypothetical protein